MATFLVCGLSVIDFADHQDAIPFLMAASVVMPLACVTLSVFFLKPEIDP